MAPSSPRTRHPFSPWGEGGPKGRMRGPSFCGLLPPHQFGRMTYGRAVQVEWVICVRTRARKSWPHVLSPEGRGDGERVPFAGSEDAGDGRDIGGVREA